MCVCVWARKSSTISSTLSSRANNLRVSLPVCISVISGPVGKNTSVKERERERGRQRERELGARGCGGGRDGGPQFVSHLK